MFDQGRAIKQPFMISGNILEHTSVEGHNRHIRFLLCYGILFEMTVKEFF